MTSLFFCKVFWQFFPFADVFLILRCLGSVWSQDVSKTIFSFIVGLSVLPLDSQSHRLTFFLPLSPCPSVHSPQLWPLSCSKTLPRKAGVQSVLIKPAGSAAPGDLLIQLSGQTLDPVRSDDCGWNLTVCIFTSPPRNSHACWSLRTTVGKGSPQE